MLYFVKRYIVKTKLSNDLKAISNLFNWIWVVLPFRKIRLRFILMISIDFFCRNSCKISLFLPNVPYPVKATFRRHRRLQHTTKHAAKSSHLRLHVIGAAHDHCRFFAKVLYSSAKWLYCDVSVIIRKKFCWRKKIIFKPFFDHRQVLRWSKETFWQRDYASGYTYIHARYYSTT